MGIPNQPTGTGTALVLSTDAKPRLKWTLELHQRFVDAVNHLGGPDKATPKSLMRVMGINGLTLYHLKSHLQKYRLGKIQPTDGASSDSDGSGDSSEGLQVARMRSLREQIEVQRHLQVRIEAQGKYLQAALKKAQDALTTSECSSRNIEAAKAELSKLVTMVDSSMEGCLQPAKRLKFAAFDLNDSNSDPHVLDLNRKENDFL